MQMGPLNSNKVDIIGDNFDEESPISPTYYKDSTTYLDGSDAFRPPL
jgi:hypothetical protein